MSYLRSRRVLLVLDNSERVPGAAPLLARLLAAAPGVVLLVTSRSVLRLNSENEFPVLPLPAPPAGAAPDAGLHGRYPSVRLFVERARAVAPEFRLRLRTREPSARSAVRLDGLPLAIELAAARVRLLPPRALLARLGGRMSVLTGRAA